MLQSQQVTPRWDCEAARLRGRPGFFVSMQRSINAQTKINVLSTVGPAALAGSRCAPHLHSVRSDRIVMGSAG